MMRWKGWVMCQWAEGQQDSATRYLKPEGWVRILSRAFGGSKPCRHLDLGLWPPKLLSHAPFVVTVAPGQTHGPSALATVWMQQAG